MVKNMGLYMLREKRGDIMKNRTSYRVCDMIGGGTKEDYIKEFNSVFTADLGVMAFDCVIEEEYTDKHGNQLADIIFKIMEVI